MIQLSRTYCPYQIHMPDGSTWKWTFCRHGPSICWCGRAKQHRVYRLSSTTMDSDHEECSKSNGLQQYYDPTTAVRNDSLCYSSSTTAGHILAIQGTLYCHRGTLCCIKYWFDCIQSHGRRRWPLHCYSKTTVTNSRIRYPRLGIHVSLPRIYVNVFICSKEAVEPPHKCFTKLFITEIPQCMSLDTRAKTELCAWFW